MSRVATEYNQTPEGINSKKLNLEGIKSEDFAIDIPTIQTIDDYEFLEDFQRGENW